MQNMHAPVLKNNCEETCFQQTRSKVGSSTERHLNRISLLMMDWNLLLYSWLVKFITLGFSLQQARHNCGENHIQNLWALEVMTHEMVSCAIFTHLCPTS